MARCGDTQDYAERRGWRLLAAHGNARTAYQTDGANPARWPGVSLNGVAAFRLGGRPPWYEYQGYATAPDESG